MRNIRTAFRSFFIWLILMSIIVGAGVFVFINYSWVFAKRVHGEVMAIERVMNPTAILGKATEEQIHSYAVMIQNRADGQFYTASSNDRQWQVVGKGYCVDALLYVYPPWNLEKSGTYFNARLNQVSLCPGQTAPPADSKLPPVNRPDPLSGSH